MKSLALTALAISLPLTQAVELATEQATKYAYCNLSNEKIKIRVTARTIGTTTPFTGEVLTGSLIHSTEPNT